MESHSLGWCHNNNNLSGGQRGGKSVEFQHCRCRHSGIGEKETHNASVVGKKVKKCARALLRYEEVFAHGWTRVLLLGQNRQGPFKGDREYTNM